MFDAIKKMMSGGEKAETHSELDPHVAATALLVEAALSDGIYADVEAEQIRSILMAAFNLDPDAAEAMQTKAEELAENAADHHQFTKVVKACLPAPERIALVEHLWSVALADGEKSPFEDSFIRRVAPLLAVSDRERVLARSRAEATARKS